MRKTIDLDDLIRPSTAARLRQITRSAVLDYIKRGKWPVAMIIDGQPFLSRQMVLGYVPGQAASLPSARKGVAR